MFVLVFLGARMKLEKDDKLGQGRGAFNPATRVQIPMGANQIHDDKLGFSSLANAKKLSSKRFGSIPETEPEKLKKHIKEVLPQLTFHKIKDGG